MQRRLEEIVELLPDHFGHVDARRVVCFRSVGSKARIYARIWSLPRIFQMALGVEAHYAVEVVEAFDRRPVDDQDRTLVHELMHIPKTFSGALVPHACFGRNIDCRSVETIWRVLDGRRRARSEAAAVRWGAGEGLLRPDPGPERRTGAGL